MKRAVFRADGSFSLGLGHIMRCLAFAEGLDQAGIESIFVTRAFDSQIMDLIRSRGYDVEEILSDATSEDDACLTRKTAYQIGAKLIITDLCHATELKNRERLYAYHQSLKGSNFIVCLAGGNELNLPAHIIVSPYFRTIQPTSINTVGQEFLLGPAYFIFRQEFIKAARVPRMIAEKARRVLVTVGGSDERHLTSKIVKALGVVQESDLNVKIVFGPTFSDKLKKEIDDILVKCNVDYTILDHNTKMAEAMLWADLAITGDGLTKYETAVTGTPSILLSSLDSDDEIKRQFLSAGSSILAGDGDQIETIELASVIAKVIGDVNQRATMSLRGKEMVDGYGIERIIAKIPKEIIQ